MTGWNLAQINVARLVAAKGDPRVRPFFDALDRINALADASPGFVWRLQEEDGGNATAIATTPDPLFIVNMSVWRDPQSLFDFVYRSAHTPVMAQRRQFFELPRGAYQAQWWIPEGELPTINDGLSRLWMIDCYGPSQYAFTLKQQFPRPGMDGAPVDHRPDSWCIGHA